MLCSRQEPDKGGFSPGFIKIKKSHCVCCKCRFNEGVVFVVLKLSEKFANVCRMTTTATISCAVFGSVKC